MYEEYRLSMTSRRCLWCSEPLTGRAGKLYCSDSCRYKAAQARKNVENGTVVFGTSAGIGSEGAARAIAGLKQAIAVVAAQGESGTPVGEQCRRVAAMMKDDLREVGL